MSSKAEITLTEHGNRYLRSKNYNYNFHGKTGAFIRWGKTEKEIPKWAPFGPEFLYIDLSDETTHMSFDIFKKILDVMPKTLTSIIFEIHFPMELSDLNKIFEHCKWNYIMPVVVMNDVTKLLNLPDYVHRCSDHNIMLSHSGLFDAFIDCNGVFRVSSDKPPLVDYVADVTSINDFAKEIWLNDQMLKWREENYGIRK